MGSATYLGECARCHVLAHAPADEPRYGCPRCGGRLGKGGVRVGFADALHLYGEPGEPWRPPAPPPPKPPRQHVLPCKDGHKARSEDEVRVDDWLHEHGIPHEPEPRLEGMRPDWRVGDTFVEYWGLAGQRGYEARREEKLALYEERGLRLVELFPEDIPHLERKLGPLRERAHLPEPEEARRVKPKAKPGKVVVENPNAPGSTRRVDAAKHAAMRDALLAALPDAPPGLTQRETLDTVLPLLPEEHFPAGEKAAWWARCVQLDLEAKGLVVREGNKPPRWRRAPSKS